ncbi:MAG TPA: hypothetical protein ENK73_02935, partial [Thiomicrospira sp.]|nr:hypothetical protein [Thiomicrospira sp.]
MSKRIKPHVEQRIVDDNIVQGDIDDKIQRGKAFSESKKLERAGQKTAEDSGSDMHTDQEEINTQSPISEGIDLSNDEKKAKKPTFYNTYKGYVLWILMFIVVILMLFITRPDTDWQIQRINDLQSEITELRQENSALDTRLQEQADELQKTIEVQVKKALANSGNPAAVSKADIEAMQNQFQQQLSGLQDKLTVLSGNAGAQLDKALADLAKMSESTKNQLTPSKEQLQALQDLESKLQQQFNGVSDKLGELFQFKTEQQTLSKQPPVLKLDMPLDSLQIQQWIIEVNTQWIMNGRINETRQQLLALEQAVSLSDYSYTNHLVRLIGQDLGYLQQLQQQEENFPLPDTQALKKAAKSLAAVVQPNAMAQTDDASENKQGLDALMAKFSQMIT